MRNTYLFFLLCFSEALFSQSNLDFGVLQYRNAGPMRGGRATAVAGVASQPNVFYMGATGGGVWKSEDYGTSWHNVSDGFFETPSIGAIRVAANDPNIVYVGTGSDGLRSNVITGKGVYKSVDAGRTWQHTGLRDAGQIGSVEIHPTNHNTVFVAAIGQAFQPNNERGVFRTKDGGKSWEKVLFLSDTTGFADIEFMPSNPNIVYAAAWRAERKPWTIISGGKEGGVYKSMDGGDTWAKLTKGLPEGLIGKIDLAVCPADSKVLYALVEAPGDQSGLYRSDDQGESFRQVSGKFELLHRPFYFGNVDADPTDPDVVYVMALRLYKSAGAGKSWTTIRTPHGDDHDLWINPNDSQLMIESNDGGANVSHNGGKSWSSQFNQPTAELYQVEVDEQYPYWLYAGQQDNYTTVAVPGLPPGSHQYGGGAFVINVGGCETGPAVPNPANPNIVYSNCKGRFSVFNKKTGQEQHYDVGACNMYGHNPNDLKFRFQRVSPVHVSPHDPGVIYHTSQYVHRTTDEGKTWEIISPDLTAFEPDKQVISGSPITRDITGEEFYSTIYAIRESKLEKGQIWVGANDGPVHVTRNGGQSWANVTPESLPPGGRVDCVEPSPHDAAKAYVAVLRYQLGDWKPYIFKTENYGKSWALLTDGENGIPANFPTRVVREDPVRAGLLYAGTGFGMFVSFDDGKNWQSFQQNLPVTPVTDIKIHRNDLVLSTMGRGLWILDNVTTLQQGYDKNDLAQPQLFKPPNTYRYLYGRSRGTDAVASPGYPPPSVLIDYFLPEKTKNPLRLDILDEVGKTVRTLISHPDSLQKQSEFVRDMVANTTPWSVNTNLKNAKGMHRFQWDMRHAGAWNKNENTRYHNGPRVSPGSYTLRLNVDGKILEQTFHLLPDPRVMAAGVILDDLKKQEALSLQIVALLSDAKKLANEVEKEQKKLKSKKEALTDAEKQRQQALEVLDKKLNTAKKQRYPQPMLLSQIGYLYGIISRAGQLPGRDVYERYEELTKEVEELKAVFGLTE
jgi:photosystem II stability/assembly factor-like uncharacterized protein